MALLRAVRRGGSMAALVAAACGCSTAPGPPVPDNASRRVLVWYDRSGDVLETIAGSEAAYDRLWFDPGETSVVARLGTAQDDLWRIDLATATFQPAPGSRTTVPHDASLSSDDRWIAYVSGESGRPEVYVATYPDEDARWLVSLPEGGRHPVWRADDLQLYYLAPGGRLMVAPIERGRRFVLPARPTLVFADDTLDGAPFAVTRDASRILIAVRR